MHCKKFAGVTYLENIAKQGVTRFIADDIAGNNLTTQEKKSKKKNVFQHPQTVVAIND